MAFDDLEEMDAALFVDPAMFPGVEPVMYRPKGGAWRTIYAQIDRDPPETVGGVELAAKPKVRIAARDHATLGILMSDLNVSGDLIRWAKVRGGSLTTGSGEYIEQPIPGTPIAQDGGLLVFEF